MLSGIPERIKRMMIPHIRNQELSISEVHAYNDPKQLPVPSYLTRKLKGQFQHACPSHLYSLIAETEKKQ
jgi:hypothetical protein